LWRFSSFQLTEAKSKSLEQGFAAALKRRFTKSEAESDPIQEELLKVCREQLGEKEVEILLDAHHKGAFSHLLGE